MPPDDPLGRHGPTLENFLRRFPKAQKKQPCPYGKKHALITTPLFLIRVLTRVGLYIEILRYIVIGYNMTHYLYGHSCLV